MGCLYKIKRKRVRNPRNQSILNSYSSVSGLVTVLFLLTGFQMRVLLEKSKILTPADTGLLN